jgi:hypothetical protein
MPRHNGHTQPVAKNRRQSLRPAHDSDLRHSWGDDARTLLRTSLAAADRGQSIIAIEAGTGGLPYPPGPRPKISSGSTTEGTVCGNGRSVAEKSFREPSLATPAGPAKSRPSPKTRKRRALARQRGDNSGKTS